MGSNERFTGLSNQGATCYMNSLLQTLFMTPEFLSRLYKWRWEPEKHNSQKDCIPFQLQLMFAKLHLKKYNVLETTGLTTSFQWDMRESLQQHDVQEFCRVLFDAIEESIKGTEQEKMITELYEGLYVDYVKCLECGQESTREDKFLDLSLAIRNSHDWEYNDSLEKALENFFKPDFLSGDNKYSCEKCSLRTNAKKGLKFSKLPYILALQLKRFDLDCTTMQRKKINDRVTFPMYLNMNLFLTEGEESQRSESSIMENHSNNANFSENTDDDCDMLKSSSQSTPILELFMNQPLNEHFYELFSIMIHSGSALGGHYYAYIKCFDTNLWYQFNDSQVKEIEKAEIEKMYGGIIGNGMFGANAYLLMYREISDKNIKKVELSEIPQYLIEEIAREDEIKLKEYKEREDRLLLIEIKVYFKGVTSLVKANKNLPLLFFTKKCIKELNIAYDEEDLRIRLYNAEYDQFQECFTNKESLSLDQLNITSNSHLGIETKTADEEFLPYNPLHLNLKVCIWRDPTPSNITFNELTLNPYRLQIGKTAKLKDLLSLFSAYFHIALDNLKIWKKSPNVKKIQIVEIPERKLLHGKILLMGIHEGSLLLIENKNVKSFWKEVADRDSEMILVRFNDPKEKKLAYDQKVMIEGKTPLMILKLHIAVLIDIHKDLFSIKRGSKHGLELTENTMSLNDLYLFNNSIIHLEPGVACEPNEITLSIYFSTLSNNSADDYLWYNFYDLFQLRVIVEISLQELKNLIVKTCGKCFPTLQIDVESIRLREKRDIRLLHIIEEGKCLRYFSDQKTLEIAIEEGPQSSIFDVACVFRQWSPSTWGLSNPIQIMLNKHSCLPEIAYILQEIYAIPLQCISVCRVIYLNNFIRGDLKDMDWVPLTTGCLASRPFFINNSGATFV